jgi:putative SOS response-associated peptidase YedK
MCRKPFKKRRCLIPADAFYEWPKERKPLEDRDETGQLPLDLLRPDEAESMEMHESNPKVGNVRNNSPELLRNTERAAESGELPL